MYVILIIVIIFIILFFLKDNKVYTKPLFDAIENNDFNKVKQIIESGFNINAKGEGGLNALFIASAIGNVEIVKFLLNKGIDPNITFSSSDGMTPLFVSQKYEIVKALIEAGANVNAKSSQRGITPIFNAIGFNNLEVVKALIEAGANVNIIENGVGYNPLFMSCYGENINDEIVKILLQNGANPNLNVTKLGINALMILKELKRDDLLKFGKF